MGLIDLIHSEHFDLQKILSQCKVEKPKARTQKTIYFHYSKNAKTNKAPKKRKTDIIRVKVNNLKKVLLQLLELILPNPTSQTQRRKKTKKKCYIAEAILYIITVTKIAIIQVHI